MVVVNEFAKHHHHHNTGGHVVENGTEEECHKCDAPQQFTLNDLYDSHRTHQEEQRGGSAAKMLFKHAIHHIGSEIGEITSGVKHKKCPSGHKHQQRNSRLVHASETLKRYECVA